MKFITTKQARVRISQLRARLAKETDPTQKDALSAEIRRLNKAGGEAEARSTYRAKLAELGRSMMGAY
jgi:hypothetical protein